MKRSGQLSGPLSENRRLLWQELNGQRGVLFRDLLIPVSDGPALPALVVYLEGEVQMDRMEAHLVRPLLEGAATGPGRSRGSLAPDSVPVRDLSEAVTALFRGEVLLQLGNTTEVVRVALNDPPLRPIMPPDTESGISGPRESFTESLVINTTQLRRRLPGSDLRLASVWIGSKAKVESVVCHIAGRAPTGVIEQVSSSLQAVTTDGLQDVTQLIEAVTGGRLSVFPRAIITERPDVVIHYMLSGRLAVLLDNSPRVAIVPALFMDFFKSSDDFYEWRPFVIFLRVLRGLAWNVAVPLPALYVALTTFHIQALPTQLAMRLMAQRQGAPLPAPVEAAVMSIIFEILREAGIRLPRAIGPTVSIVGGLVIGDAAIRSGLTSPVMVLVVSATAVATFSLPSTTLANAATYYRFVFLALSTIFGFFGLLAGYLLVLTNLAGMSSFGMPMASPFFPLIWKLIPAAIGLRARPPADEGSHMPPDLVWQAQAFQERGEL